MANAARKHDAREVEAQATAHALIDTDRYPIYDRESTLYADVVADLHRQLEETGCAVVPGFVRPDALDVMRRESEELAPRAHYRETHTNPYNSADDPSLPETHPKRLFQDRSNAFVAGDLIDAETCIRQLYHDAGLQAFIADILGVDRIYEYADPLAGLVVNVLKEGCQHPWHFDTNEFIVSMMTKQPEAGGAFEYCPGIRGPEDENLDGVSETVRGDRRRVRTLDLKPGDLQIFFGRYSLHRVTRPQGAEDRHTLILGYTKEPNVVGKAERSRKLFGRVAEVHTREDRQAPNRADTLAD
jgi:hypothetical protein